eukprot:TRINITY_DN77_c1_g1_i1.p3 TRINITY_DN77_c1_g1~~TRINITY_DN77_c1_g1_i1.p3  ORF type:complete len:421 (+),score=44.63 TRINITY_DN77_c1_g1_i1:159-1421(+)
MARKAKNGTSSANVASSSRNLQTISVPVTTSPPVTQPSPIPSSVMIAAAVALSQRQPMQPPSQQQPVQQQQANSYIGLSPVLCQSISDYFANHDLADELPPFFDGQSFLSKNVDFQLFKGFKEFPADFDYESYSIGFFNSLRRQLSESDRWLIRGGMWNSGKGGYQKEFQTYRVIFRTKDVNSTQIDDLVTRLLNGISFNYGQYVVKVPAVLSPTNSFYKTKIIRLGAFDEDKFSGEFGAWFHANILKKLQGFENSSLSRVFMMWNKNWKYKDDRMPDLSSLYLLVDNVASKTVLDDKYMQADLGNSSMLTVTKMSFAFNRQLLLDYFAYLQWPQDKLAMQLDSLFDDSDDDEDDNGGSHAYQQQQATQDPGAQGNAQSDGGNIDDAMDGANQDGLSKDTDALDFLVRYVRQFHPQFVVE